MKNKNAKHMYNHRYSPMLVVNLKKNIITKRSYKNIFVVRL